MAQELVLMAKEKYDTLTKSSHNAKNQNSVQTDSDDIPSVNTDRDSAENDRSVVSGFGAQAYPGKTKYFKDAYEKATSQPYGYLVSDMTVTCPNEYRLRTKIFPNEDTHVFVPQ